MSLFSRNKVPVEPVRADEGPFDALSREPRGVARGLREAVRNGSRAGSRNGSRNGSRKIGAAVDSDLDAPPLDPAHSAKARARRRLIGAIALAFAAVVFVPMLFDRAPVTPVDDIAVQIPDRDTPFEGRRGIPDAKGPLRPSASLPGAVPASQPGSQPGSRTTSVPPTPTHETTDATGSQVTAVDPSKGAPAVQTKAANPPTAGESDKQPGRNTQDKSPDRSTEKHTDKPHQNAAEKPAALSPAGDDPRALAALAGKPVLPASSENASERASGKGFAIQIAAFSVADKARSLRDQLNANGLKAYTEPLSTSQGPRTRVRLGPFASREAAERARQKLRTMKLDGSVVPL